MTNAQKKHSTLSHPYFSCTGTQVLESVVSFTFCGNPTLSKRFLSFLVFFALSIRSPFTAHLFPRFFLIGAFKHGAKASSRQEGSIYHAPSRLDSTFHLIWMLYPIKLFNLCLKNPILKKRLP